MSFVLPNNPFVCLILRQIRTVRGRSPSHPLISFSWLGMANNPKKCHSWKLEKKNETHFFSSTFPLHTDLQVACIIVIAFKWLLTTTQSTSRRQQQQIQKKTSECFNSIEFYFTLPVWRTSTLHTAKYNAL